MKKIAIEWLEGRPEGDVEIVNGRLAGFRVVRGKGDTRGGHFAVTAGGPCRLEVAVEGEDVTQGGTPTFVTVRAEKPFTVLLRDVDRACPVWIPAPGVVVTAAEDARSGAEIVEAIKGRGLKTAIGKFADEPEETYEQAAAHTHALRAPIWLGLSRDIRIFELRHDLAERAFFITPRLHGEGVSIPEGGDKAPVSSYFLLGRGVGCIRNIARRLEDGALPILLGALVDDTIEYKFTAFVTLEKSSLVAKNIRGTHFLVADGHGFGHMFTDEQDRQFKAMMPGELDCDEETVLYYRVEAVNTGDVPRYAWMQAPALKLSKPGAQRLDGQRGFGVLDSGRVFLTATLNGAPMPQSEVAVLVKPGEAAVCEFRLPHRPVSPERAAALAAQDYDARHAECRTFWQKKLAGAASLKLPEKRIDEMARAGLLHLDLVAYGREPAGPVAATIGVYCPIGSESSPIIQFMDSMGLHKLAERSLEYFLEKQHADGFIQNFGGYMLETGPALWSMGEHFRYTRDVAWVRRIEPKLLKACDYLRKWRARNLKDELRGNGYGMMEGKVADPEDHFRSFMLNGYACMGMSRVAEMLADVNPAESVRIAREAQALKADILRAVQENLAKSPVVPMGDGSWCPTMGPWAEARGPVSLLTDGLGWLTHGTCVGRDSLIGPLYLIFSEVLDPDGLIADQLIGYHADLMHSRNVAFSQPYYSPHPWIHLERGEVKAFLKAYYNTFAALADRETYSFWEHFFHVSPHKTHEESWFLMQTRWMLYKEHGTKLRLLPGIPRAWLERGKRIELNNVASYFGPVTLKVESAVDGDFITATVECTTDRKPATVEVRLPHAQGRKAVSVYGGVYEAATEMVRIECFNGKAAVKVVF